MLQLIRDKGVKVIIYTTKSLDYITYRALKSLLMGSKHDGCLELYVIQDLHAKMYISDNSKVLITTANFLSRNYDLLSKTKFKLIVVDDVDAILRNSKNIERILSLFYVGLLSRCAKSRKELKVLMHPTLMRYH